MIKTFNRRVQQVNIPSAQNVKRYNFNYSQWKGMCDDKNYIGVDQETFEDCCNVYVDENGVLRSRPAIKIATVEGLQNVVNVWNFDILQAYQIVYTEDNTIKYKLVFRQGSKTSDQLISVPKDFQLVLADEKIFLFAENRLAYLDIKTDPWQWHDSNNNDAEVLSTIYVPTITENEKESESVNELTTGVAQRFVYDTADEIQVDKFSQQVVNIKIGDLEYNNILFTVNTPMQLVDVIYTAKDNTLYSTTVFGANGADIPFIDVVNSDTKHVILLCYADEQRTNGSATYQIYYSIDWVTFIYVDTKTCYFVPKLSNSGTDIVILTSGKLQVKSIIPDTGSEVLQYPDWTTITSDIKTNRCSSVDFYDADNYVVTYGGNNNSSNSNYNNLIVARKTPSTLQKTDIIIGTSKTINSITNLDFNRNFDGQDTDTSHPEFYNYDKYRLIQDGQITIEQLNDAIANNPYQASGNVAEINVQINDKNNSSNSIPLDIYFDNVYSSSGVIYMRFRVRLNNNGKSVTGYLNISYDKTSGHRLHDIETNGGYKYVATESIFLNYLDGSFNLSNADLSGDIKFRVDFHLNTSTYNIEYMNIYVDCDIHQTNSVIGVRYEAPNVKILNNSTVFVEVPYTSNSSKRNDIYKITNTASVLVGSVTSHRNPQKDHLVVANGTIKFATIRNYSGTDVRPHLYTLTATSTALTNYTTQKYSCTIDDIIRTDGTNILLPTSINGIQLLQGENNLPISVQNRKIMYVDKTTNSVFSSYEFKNRIEIFVQTGGSLTIPKIDFVSKLQSYYFVSGNKLLISAQGANVSPGEFKWYFPKINTQKFDYDISAIHPISQTEMALFFEHAIYYVTPTEYGYAYYKSRIPLGCKYGSDIVTSYDGKYTIFATQRGLVAMSYQDFISSTEQALTYLSDNIFSKFDKWNIDAVKITQYKFWLIIYRVNNEDAFVFDMRNNSIWPIKVKLTVNENNIKVYSIDNILYMLLGNQIHSFDTSDYNYRDASGNIVWYVVSQKLHFGAINYTKHILNLTLNALSDNDEDTTMKLDVVSYRENVLLGKGRSLQYSIDLLHTFVQQLNYQKVNEFQFILSSDDNKQALPLSLTNIGIKYKLTGQVN